MNEELTIELLEENIEIETIEENVEIELKSNEIVRTEATSDYNQLTNKPQIEGVELLGDKSLEELGIRFITNLELEYLLK